MGWGNTIGPTNPPILAHSIWMLKRDMDLLHLRTEINLRYVMSKMIRTKENIHVRRTFYLLLLCIKILIRAIYMYVHSRVVVVFHKYNHFIIFLWNPRWSN